MFIDVSPALMSPGSTFPLDVRLEIEPEVIADDPVSFEDVRLVGTFSSDGDAISLAGRITCHIKSRCALCLEPAEADIETDAEAPFVRGAPPDDPNRYALTGSRLDPASMVREAILLALPMRYLCRADCKGLCPGCGSNLNRVQSCACPAGGGRENPFAALRALNTDNEEV